MRSILTTALLIMAITVMIAPSKAQSINWNANIINVTEWSDATGVSTRINAKRHCRPVGGTSTKLGTLFVITDHPWMSYEAALSTVGIDSSKVVDAILTPDGGETCWVPTFVKGKGFVVALPIGNTTIKTRCKALKPKKHSRDKDEWEEQIIDLPATGLAAGEMSSLEWKLAVRDKHNRIMIVIIPITWTSERKLSMGTDIMVQKPIEKFNCLPDTEAGDRQALAFLRGFVSSWNSEDQAIAAQEQMANNGGASQPPASQPPATPPPALPQSAGTLNEPPPVAVLPAAPVQPVSEGLTREQVQAMIDSQTSKTPSPATVQSPATPPIIYQPQQTFQPVYQPIQPVLTRLKVFIWAGNACYPWGEQSLNLAVLCGGQRIEFRRCVKKDQCGRVVDPGILIATGVVQNISTQFANIEFRLLSGYMPQQGDSIIALQAQGGIR